MGSKRLYIQRKGDIIKVIILAGGKGTRLQKVIKDTPKPMADINGKPFLEYLFEFLLSQGIKEVTLSVGYKKEIIIDYFGDFYKNLKIDYSIENEPLGTGGAIKNIDFNEAIILNGDTFFNVNLQNFIKFTKNTNIGLIVKKINNADRYGAVKIKNNIIYKFEEKKFYKEAYINGGIYYIKKFILKNMPKIFSFEKFLENNVESLKIKAFESDSFFIDIGVPKDYLYAKKVLK